MAATYEASKESAKLSGIIEHFDAFGVEIQSISTAGGKYLIVSADGFPEEQLEHLGMVRVA